jgi:hypothetical protein
MLIFLSSAYKFVSNIPPFKLTPYAQKMCWIINVELDVTGQILIIHVYSAFVKYLRRSEYNEGVNQLFIDFEKDYDSVRRLALHNILMECSNSMKLVRPIKMRLIET